MTTPLLTTTFLTLLVVGCAMAKEAATTTRASDPVAAMRWERRVVIVFANDATEQKLARQRELFASAAEGMAERKLAVVEVVGDAVTIDGKPTPIDEATLSELRRRFDGRPEMFRVVLVGLDGGEKLRRDEPVWPNLLFETIDAMPMRRAEQK